MDRILKALSPALFLLFSPLCASNLAELIELSLQNESYLAKNSQHQQSENDYQAAFASYLPSLSLSGAYVANNKDRRIIDAQEALFAKFSLNFLLFDGGKREATLRGLEFKKNLSALDRMQSKNALALNAITLYFNYLSLEKIIKAQEQKALFLEKTLLRVQKFHRAGLSAKDELESIRARYHLANLEFLQKKLGLEGVKKELTILSQRNFIPEEGARMKELGDERASNVEILKAKERVGLAQEALSIAKAEFFPRFFVQNHFAFYKNHHPLKLASNLQNFSEGLAEKYAQNNQFVLGFEWKIFDFDARGRELENRRLDVQISRANLKLAQRQNEEELAFLRKNLQVLVEQISTLKIALDAANLAFESVDKKYTAGLCSYVEYLGALEAKFRAAGELELAENELEITKANYYFLAGFDLEERIVR